MYWIEFLKPFQLYEPGKRILVGIQDDQFPTGSAELLIDRKVARKCDPPVKRGRPPLVRESNANSR